MLPFDEDYYLEINVARWQAAERILDALPSLGLRTALDIACGPGWFTRRLIDRGLDVTGLEGRVKLVTEAQKRVPEARFVQTNLNNSASGIDIVPSDLVFCFGCLYHLENPLLFLRQLNQWTGKLLLLETQVIPDDKAIFQMVDEGRNVTQGLNFASLIPSDSAVVKALSWAGFEHIYESQNPVAHQDFHDTKTHHRRRRIYIAAMSPITIEGIVVREPKKVPKPLFNKIP